MCRMRIESSDVAGVMQGVGPASRTLRLDRVFWSHFSPNLAPAAWVIGVLVASLVPDRPLALLLLVLGNLLGALPVAACATMGPQTGLPQMEMSRFAFGSTGKRLPALINWLGCVGWDAVNNVPSTIALVLLARHFGLPLPFWLALGLLGMLQLLAGAAGHDMVQAIERNLGYVLLAAFALTGIVAALHGPAPGPARGVAVDLPDLVLAVAAVASFNMAWAPFASDYTRYLPATTPVRHVFWLTLAGVFSSALLMEVFGVLTAAAIGDPSPGAVIGGLQSLTGRLAPVALAAVALSSVAINAANDNSAAYGLISAGVRLNRPLSAVLTACLAYLLAAWGEGRFTVLYENALLLALYWVAPWAGIVLTDWAMRRRSGLPLAAPPGWGPSASLFVAVSIVTVVLFSSTPLYVGPVARLLGGADLGSLAGFLLAAGGQALLLRRTRRSARQPGGRPA